MGLPFCRPVLDLFDRLPLESTQVDNKDVMLVCLTSGQLSNDDDLANSFPSLNIVFDLPLFQIKDFVEESIRPSRSYHER